MTFMLLFKPILILFKKSTKKAIQYFYLKRKPSKNHYWKVPMKWNKELIPAWVEILA